MSEIMNPVIPGMAADPSIIKVDNYYYVATSSFHWHPCIQLYKSEDLCNWSLVDSIFTQGEIHLAGTNTPAGIWAPNLSYDPKTATYWLAYSHMLNMSGREFNADSYIVSAKSIQGPWSKPIYLTSIGFDPAIFHDDDGKHYVAILEWETREGYQAPGHIVIAEFDLQLGKPITEWKRVTQGFTTRGCAEAPWLCKRNGYYYLIIAAGGTGYAHGVEIGRSKSIFGPYEAHPSGEPIVTSSPRHLFSLGDPDAGHFEMYNPNSVMQKSGHGSLVETASGEWYLAHLMSRPLPNTLLNPLGRETSIQKMRWTEEGWLEMADGSNLAKMNVEAPSNHRQVKQANFDVQDEFDSEYAKVFMTPYWHQDNSWVNTKERAGHLRIYGGHSLFSRMQPAIMATRATSFNYELHTKVEFHPNHYSERAGVGLYYDSNNWLFFNINYNEQKRETELTLLQAKLGVRNQFVNHIISLPKGVVELKIIYQEGIATLFYKVAQDWQAFLEPIDVSYLSDEGVNGEPGEIGGFTGLFNFIGAVDSHQRDSFADFDFYRVTNFKE